ncbi:MAG TPA: membrane metalloprotease [Flavobacterium sp.]|uniref:membrane metalloprotease n=1 Tax=Flavobacterium sp. TaxID=239 RepID=UPI002F422B6D
MKKGIALLTLAAVLLVSCAQDDSANNTSAEGNLISNNQKTTGSSANDLLSDAAFKSMVIEVVYVQGFEPSATSISNFVSFLNARTYKPEGITVVKRAIASTGKTSYTNQDIVAIEDANRTKYNSSNQIAVWAFFADAESASNTDTGLVLGTAYRNTSFVIYEKTLQGLSDSPFEPNRSLLETTVITHEFGHILGLTNFGTALQSNHEDTAHPKHCNVESCLMYWSAESGNGIKNMVSGGSAPQLDSQCIADLRANGGK